MVFKAILRLVAVFVLIVISFIAGSYSIDKTGIEKSGYDTGYNTAWERATKLVDSSQTAIFPAQKEMFSIGGVIKTISDSSNSMTIEASSVSENPLSGDSKTTMRTIKTTSKTKLVRIIAKTPGEIQAVVDVNQITLPFKEEGMLFDQFKEGDRVMITSDKNIKNEMEITPLKVTLQQK